MRLTSQAQQDLGWWTRNVTLASHFLHTHSVGLTLFSDASLEGWGGTDGTSHVGGRLTDDKSPIHINVLELQAAKLTLMALAPNVSHSHIRLMLDNTTATAYIDEMEGLHSPSCNEIALSIWHWAKDRNIWLSTAVIPGVENTVADFHSRNFRDNTEWMLNPVVFKQLSALSFVPEVDLFASRLNCQLTPICVLETGTWGVGSECLLPLLDCSQVLCFPSL